MVSTPLIIFLISVAVVWLGFRLKEDVYRLAVVVTGIITLIWDLTWASDSLQLFLGLLSMSVYPLWRGFKL